jgi:autotransporter translocation and assembly factor TamB
MKKRVFLIVLAAVLALPLVLIGLLYTEAGTRWLLRQGFAFLPAEIAADAIEGRLLGRLTLTGFDYRSDTAHIAVDRFVFAWKPARLFGGTLAIDEIVVDTPAIILTPSEAPAAQKPFAPNSLPRLPIGIFIGRARITDLTFRQGETEQRLDELQFSARTENERLIIPDLALKTDNAALNARAEVTLRGELAFLLAAEGQAAAGEYGDWKGKAQLQGDARQIRLESQLASPFELQLKGTADDWSEKPKLNLHAEWRKLAWPLAAKAPQVRSDSGRLELSGPLRGYWIVLNGELSPAALPKAMLALKGRGSLETLEIEALELRSPDGVFRASGGLAWPPDEITFDLALNAQDFNPAVLSPELPGKVSMAVRSGGRLAGGKLWLDARIDKLAGNLRGRPLRGGGGLALADDRLKADNLTLASGPNKLALNGTLGSARDTLDAAIEASNLNTLWPTLGGRFEGSAQLRGALKQPSLSFQGKGQALRFGEHRIERADIAIDYQAGAQENSTLAVSARSIQSGGLLIEQLSVDASGSERRHRFQARIESIHANIAAAFDGDLNDGRWEGKLTRLDIRRPSDGSQWELEKPWPMRAQKKPEGVEFALDTGCLAGQKSSVCANGHYWPNSDFKLAAQVANFPTGLFQDYFPAGFSLIGLLDADIDFNRQKQRLSGKYNVSLPGRTTLQLPAKPKPQTIALGPLAVSGALKGQEVTAVADVKLVEQDYLRGNLRLNTAAPQTLSGRIDASVRRLDLIKSFAPALSNIKGHLRADLGIEGSLQKPEVTGTLALTEGLVEMTGAGIALREIDLRATASGRRETRIQLQGSTRLAMLSSPGVTVQKPVQERIEADAEAVLHENTLSAALKLGIGSRNRIDADMRMDTGERQTLDGRITASLTDWSLLAPLTDAQLGDIKGRLAADFRIAGQTDAPEIRGDMTLSEGGAAVLPLGIAVRDIRLRATADMDNERPVRIEGSARSGQGTINLDGFADLSGNGQFRLQGNRFEAARLPEAQVTVSPDLSLLMTAEARKISGTLAIPKARIELKELPENAVPVSKDEVILGEEKKREEAVPPIPLDANVEIELGREIRFSGMGLKTGLTGKLRVSKAGEKIAANGNIDMEKGSYKSYGQDLAIKRGKIAFNGPLDNPWLDVEATRLSKDEKVTAIVNVSGPLKTPKTRLSSNPPLPETDVLAYLVTGGPLDQVGQSEGEMVAGAALAYGSSRVGWIANKLGFSEFEIKQGKTLEDTLVQAGRYLAPGFYVGAKVGLFNNQAALVMKRRLTENLNLETQAGTAQRVKINYEFDTD